MLRKTLNRAINYYEEFDYITIVNNQGVIEYSAIYCAESRHFINENVSGMHILDIYNDLSEESSTILRSLKTGKEILDNVQKLAYRDNRVTYLLSSDFPVISNGSVSGVIEVSLELNRERYKRYLANDSTLFKRELFCLDDIKTDNEQFIKIKDTVEKISKTNSSVLISGETGTGKDMIAQALHTHSYRVNKPFITQNCAAIPSTLLESTFFGTVKGAYTGAEDRAGLFELANGGTLFLDEINSMDLGLQAKLLKAIEEKAVRRVGCNISRKFDVRIVSAMNINPKHAIENKTLRKDLLYRLNVVYIEVPPLRERKEDIKMLTDHFIEKYNKEMKKDILGLSEAARILLHEHSWTGNVRELQNAIESSFNIANGNIVSVEDLPYYLLENEDEDLDKADVESMSHDLVLSLKSSIEHHEKHLIQVALRESKSFAEAARKLDISPQSLQYKVKKHKISL